MTLKTTGSHMLSGIRHGPEAIRSVAARLAAVEGRRVTFIV